MRLTPEQDPAGCKPRENAAIRQIGVDAVEHQIAPVYNDRQQSYLLEYCAHVKELAKGSPTLGDAGTQELTARMKRFLPTEALAWLIPLGADVVAGELG